MTSLAELQRQFWEAVRTRGAPPPSLEHTFQPGASQSAAERLSVYHLAYWHRQVLALASTFPKLRALVGESRFERWALRYVEQRPALHPCIEMLGEGFPAYLAETAELPALEVGLAELEWTNVACLLASDAPSTLAEPPPELGPRLADCSLSLSPALFLVRVPASAARAFDERLPLDPSCDRAAVTFFRTSFHVRYAVVDEDEAKAMTLAQGGSSLATICEAFAGAGEDATERALVVLGGWFRKRWVVRANLEDDRVSEALASA